MTTKTSQVRHPPVTVIEHGDGVEIQIGRVRLKLTVEEWIALRDTTLEMRVLAGIADLMENHVVAQPELEKLLHEARVLTRRIRR